MPPLFFILISLFAYLADAVTFLELPSTLFEVKNGWINEHIKEIMKGNYKRGREKDILEMAIINLGKKKMRERNMW